MNVTSLRTSGIMLAVLASCAAFALAAEGKTPAKREPIVATADEIAAWVRQLDDDVFARREEATENLILVGQPAIGELQALDLPAQNLEVITRGVYVLQELALSDDRPTEDAARAVLETLAESTSASASRSAQTTLGALNQIRQGRAIEDLKRLGVKVAISSSQVGPVFIQEVLTVDVGEDFTGKSSDLKLLSYLQDIQLVNLDGDKIDDQALRHISSMENVTFLKIKRAKISNAGIEYLTKLPKLQQLSILYCPLDDSAIKTLSEFKLLTDVRLYGTDMTRAGAQRLGVALAGAKVDYRHGAFLGIGCQAAGRGCEITLVHPNSAAAKAGLQPGDVILKFTGEAVADFEGLTALIAKYKAGDKVAFDVLRTGGPERIEVTLGAWE